MQRSKLTGFIFNRHDPLLYIRSRSQRTIYTLKINFHFLPEQAIRAAILTVFSEEIPAEAGTSAGAASSPGLGGVVGKHFHQVA
jgi:hypothetical protein